MSLYARLYLDFYKHPKTLKLKAAIGESALWIPPALWCYAAEYQIDGNFSGCSAEEISSFIGYSGDATSMLQALLRVGFMDPDPLRIHDWEIHNAFHAKNSKKAKKAAEARWAKAGVKKEEKSLTLPKEEIDKREGEGDKHCSAHCLSDAPSIPKQPPLFPETGDENPDSIKRFIIPTQEEVTAYCRSKALTESDSIWFWNKCQANGWTNGGQKIKSWTHTISAWKAAGWIPSLKEAKEKSKKQNSNGNL